MLASAGVDLKFNHWPDDGFQVMHPTTAKTPIQFISWSAADKYISFVPEYGRVEIINVSTVEAIKVVRTIDLPDATVCCFPKTWTKSVAIGGGAGKLLLFDTGVAKNNIECKYALSEINFVDFNSDDQCVAAAGDIGSIIVYSTIDGQILSQYPASKVSNIGGMRFHPKEPNLLASTNESGQVMIWDITTIEPVYQTRVHSSSCIGLDLAFNYDLLVTAGGNRKFSVYNWNIDECIFKGNVDEPLSAVDLSNDGVSLAIGGESGTIYVYDIRYLLQPVASWRPHPGRVNNIRFGHKVNLVDSCPQSETTKSKRKQNYASSSRTQTVREELEPTPSEPTQELEIMKPAPPKSQATLNEEKQTEIDTLSVVKAEVKVVLQKKVEDIKELIVKQLASVQNYIVQEMSALEANMANKLNLLKFPASHAKDETRKQD